MVTLKAYKPTPVPSTGIKDLFTSLLELNFKLWNSNRSKKVRAALKGFWIKNRSRTNCQTRIESIKLDFFRRTQEVFYISQVITNFFFSFDMITVLSKLYVRHIVIIRKLPETLVTFVWCITIVHFFGGAMSTSATVTKQ